MFSSTPGARIDRRVDEQFIDLICADDELMQAEFDEIVAAEWAVPPPVDSTCGATADSLATSGDHRPRAPRSRTETRQPFPTSRPAVSPRSAGRRSTLAGRLLLRHTVDTAAASSEMVDIELLDRATRVQGRKCGLGGRVRI